MSKTLITTFIVVILGVVVADLFIVPMVSGLFNKQGG